MNPNTTRTHQLKAPKTLYIYMISPKIRPWKRCFSPLEKEKENKILEKNTCTEPHPKRVQRMVNRGILFFPPKKHAYTRVWNTLTNEACTHQSLTHLIISIMIQYRSTIDYIFILFLDRSSSLFYFFSCLISRVSPIVKSRISWSNNGGLYDRGATLTSISPPTSIQCLAPIPLILLLWFLASRHFAPKTMPSYYIGPTISFDHFIQ